MAFAFSCVRPVMIKVDVPWATSFLAASRPRPPVAAVRRIVLPSKVCDDGLGGYIFCENTLYRIDIVNHRSGHEPRMLDDQIADAGTRRVLVN